MKRILDGFIAMVMAAACFAPTMVSLKANDIDTLEKAWTAVGSTGALDAASLSIAKLNDTGSIAIQSSVHSGVVTVRYNVTAVDGIHNAFSADDTVCLWASVRANSAAARVRVRLVQVPWAPNPNALLGEIDSGAGFNDTDYHVMQNCAIHQPATTGGIPSFGFFLRAYFIQVELIKTAPDGNPGLKVVALSHDQA
jgi:hypothetical protein